MSLTSCATSTSCRTSVASKGCTPAARSLCKNLNTRSYSRQAGKFIINVTLAIQKPNVALQISVKTNSYKISRSVPTSESPRHRGRRKMLLLRQQQQPRLKLRLLMVHLSLSLIPRVAIFKRPNDTEPLAIRIITRRLDACMLPRCL